MADESRTTSTKPRTPDAIRDLDTIGRARIAIAQARREAEAIVSVSLIDKAKAEDLFWEAHSKIEKQQFMIGEIRRLADTRVYRGDEEAILVGSKECRLGLNEAKGLLCAAFTRIHAEPKPSKGR